MVSVCTVPARGGRSCEHFGGYKTINYLYLYTCHPPTLIIMINHLPPQPGVGVLWQMTQDINVYYFSIWSNAVICMLS